jgi:hypothetical protein
VRWSSQGGGKRSTKEGVVTTITREDARGGQLASNLRETFGWPDDPRSRHGWRVAAVEVDTINGQPRTRGPRYYRPRVEWLERVETKGGGR